VEPIPETAESVGALGSLRGEDDLLEQLIGMSESVREVVPECVGMSLGYLADGTTMTLAATSTEIALLDAVQYLDGGPCVEAVEAGQVLEVNEPDALDESAWRLFSEATAGAGIKSTLTLPILVNGNVTGSVNLYAASPRAFSGHHQQLADIFGASAPHAVTNADLGFNTRAVAEEAPLIMREDDTIQTALGYLTASYGVDQISAYERLEDAASRAGVTVLRFAQTIVDLRGSQSSE